MKRLSFPDIVKAPFQNDEQQQLNRKRDIYFFSIILKFISICVPVQLASASDPIVSKTSLFQYSCLFILFFFFIIFSSHISAMHVLTPPHPSFQLFTLSPPLSSPVPILFSLAGYQAAVMCLQCEYLVSPLTSLISSFSQIPG